MAFKFEVRKSVHTILFLLHCLGGEADIRRLFLLLYLADRSYMATKGTTISGDIYIAMKYGPAPYHALAMLRQLKEAPGENRELTRYKKHFIFGNNAHVIANARYSADHIAPSEVAILFQIVNQYKKLSFDELSQQAIGKAWQGADENGEINLSLIAEEGHATPEMIAYIMRSFQDENKSF